MQQPRAQKYLSELFAKRPPELDEQWPAIRSYLDGDAAPLRAFVKKHVGASPSSSFVFPALEGRDIGALDEWETWELIKHHKNRLEVRGAVEVSKRVRPKVKKYQSLQDALRSLSDVYGTEGERVLLDKIEEIVLSTRASELSDSELVRAITNCIRREGTRARKSLPRSSLL
jgi:hypothetical protein